MRIDVAIIGAGPAGLSAGIFGCRAGLSMVCFEKLSVGGQAGLSYEIANYPGFEKISGFDLVEKMEEHAKSMGLKILFEEVKQVKKLKTGFSIKTNTGSYQAKKIILACGSRAKLLGLKNEKKLTGKGVSYCASCDGNFFKNKVVAVVGGGYSACEDVTYLSRICKKVYLLVRGENLRAGEFELNKLEQLKNVSIKFNTQVRELLGDEVLCGVRVDTPNGSETIALSGLFVAIGFEPDLHFLDFELKKDKDGYVKVDEDMRTSESGVFACGDIVSKKFKQVISACADGARAGNSCIGG